MTRPVSTAGGRPVPAQVAEPPERPRRGRPWLVPVRLPVYVALVLLVGLLGALVTAGVLAARPDRYQATVLFSVQPDPPLSGADGGSSEPSNSYLQGQVLEVRSVADGVRPPGVTLSVSQVGLTSVLQVDAVADDAAAAVAAANDVVARYSDTRRREVQQRADDAQAQVQRQLDALSAALDDPERADQAGASRDAISSGLATEYARLLSVRNQIALTASNTADVAVVRPASEEDVTTTSSARRTALLVGLVLALATAGLALVHRRRVEDLQERSAG